MILRPYDAEKDKEAIVQVWHEVGWIDKAEEKELEGLDRWFAGCRLGVAEVDGRVECGVTTHDGTLRYLDEDLSMCAVTGVGTSFVGRKRGLAARLTAKSIAEDAAAGCDVSSLGMFEQGFYNRLGFGTGTHRLYVSFDPAALVVRTKARPPLRITADDWKEAHAARLASFKRHGATTITDPSYTRSHMDETKGFGLGYRADDGRITHMIWFGKPKDRCSGPFDVHWLAYETLDEFVELLGLLKRLGDQVRTIKMMQPPGIQLQDFISTPFRYEIAREESREHRAGTNAWAGWQTRINDLTACLAKTHLFCDGPRFNLKLADPIEKHLEDDAPWRGCGGDYVVTLGPESSAEKGADASLPTLEASVNAFSRMWLGVLPARTLAVSDDLSGPPELLSALERAFTLPAPTRDWGF